MKRASPICRSCGHTAVHLISGGQDVCQEPGGCECECYVASFEVERVYVAYDGVMHLLDLSHVEVVVERDVSWKNLPKILRP